MDNNDLLIRLRYALNLRDSQVQKIFELGGMTLSIEDIKKVLTKAPVWTDADEQESEQENIPCNNKMLDAFLNGFIIYKRGPMEQKPDQPNQPISTIKRNNVNNIFLKKVKIALSLTAEEILEILELAGITISKGELGAVLRKEGHKNYKECGDRYIRNFLKGLTIKHRGVSEDVTPSL